VNSTRQELGTATKLVGFVVGIALVFFLALFVGHAIGPDASPSEPTHSDHESHDGTSALYPDFQPQGVVRTATFVIEAEGNQG
jgi:hypothetical protein